MFACVSPSYFNKAETMNTIEKAYEAKKIKNKAKQNCFIDPSQRAAFAELLKKPNKDAEVEKYQSEIKQLISELDNFRAAEQHLRMQHEKEVSSLQHRVEKEKKEKETLKTQVEKLEKAVAFHGPTPPDSRDRTAVRTYRHKETVFGCDFHPKSALFATASVDGIVRLYEPEKHERPCFEFKNAAFPGSCTCVAFSSDGSILAASGDDGQIVLFDMSTKQEKMTLTHKSRTGESPVLCIAWAPKGGFLADAGYDGLAYIWNTNDGSVVQRLSGHGDVVSAVTWSPNAKFAVTSCHDGKVRIWDAKTGQSSELVHGANVWSVSFGPSGDEILSCGGDHVIKLWAIWPWPGQVKQVFIGHAGPVTHAVFWRGGSTIVSVSKDRTVRIWDKGSGNKLSTLVGHMDAVYRISIQKDLILTCSGDRSCKIWDRTDKTSAPVPTPRTSRSSVGDISSFQPPADPFAPPTSARPSSQVLGPTYSPAAPQGSPSGWPQGQQQRQPPQQPSGGYSPAQSSPYGSPHQGPAPGQSPFSSSGHPVGSPQYGPGQSPVGNPQQQRSYSPRTGGGGGTPQGSSSGQSPRTQGAVKRSSTAGNIRNLLHR
eukprot:NODE_520_length_2008_cov_14.504849_g415_i0.p1 GENE.NODE_520_length_2008_cov_14.504849_g415_i0~~NODE_520_length_2008_cov_14.504849_g415_i0.p1  ORF type:complete len:596 (+),score=155.75 NODE_520_length_2008_cov_14.504849_g415_i0:39-1826(+)